MVKKEQGQEDYFGQESIFLTLPISATKKAGNCEKYAFLTKIIILSLFLFNHCHSHIAVHFLEILLLFVHTHTCC